MEQLIEQIVPIKGYEGLYLLSNYGYVISEAREWILPNGGFNRKSETIINQRLIGSGYPSVNLYKLGNRKTRTVHLLVWDHFGDRPRNGRKLQVDHIDENKLNPRIDNLQLLTPRENTSKYHKTRKTTSQFTGIAWHKKNKKWVARIRLSKKETYLGSFDSELDAHIAYQEKLAEVNMNDPADALT